MKIMVKLFGTLTGIVSGFDHRDNFVLEMPKDAAITDLLSRLKISTQSHLSVVVNGKIKKQDDLLKEGDSVNIFVAMAGG